MGRGGGGGGEAAVDYVNKKQVNLQTDRQGLICVAIWVSIDPTKLISGG